MAMNSVAADVCPANPAGAIETQRPIVHIVPGALDDICCLAERLTALFRSNTTDLNDCIIEDANLPKGLQDRAYSIWMIFVLAGEKLDELREFIDATNDAAHKQTLTVTA